jgi:hypothetical protein
MKILALAASAALIAGCSLFRVDADQPPARLLCPAWAGAAAPPTLAADAPRLRLLPVVARPQLRPELVQVRSGGEVAPDPRWRWSETPDRYLAVALGDRLPRAGLRAVEDPDAPALRVTLLECLADAGAHELRLVAHLRLVGPAGEVREAVRRAVRPWNGELPGDLATQAAAAIDALADEVAAAAVAWLADPAPTSSQR